MFTGITWEEETEARLSEARAKEKEAQEAIKQAETNAKQWGEYALALERVLGLARQQTTLENSHSPFPQGHDPLQQSTWENLKVIAAAKEGLLVAVEAVSFLVKMKVFNDREHARNVIYSTLYSHKKDVEQVRPGVYRVLDTSIRTHMTGHRQWRRG